MENLVGADIHSADTVVPRWQQLAVGDQVRLAAEMPLEVTHLDPGHVLDLALFLPAVLASAALLLRRRPLGYVTAPGVLLFLILTCLPVLVTPLMSLAYDRDPDWGAAAPIGFVLLVSTGVLVRTVRRPH